MTGLLNMILSGWQRVVALSVAFLAVLGAAYLKGKAAANNAATRRAQRQKIEALEDRLEMHREADEIERQNRALNRDEKERRARRWSR